MDTIQGFITFLLVLIPIAASARIVACIIYIQMDEDPGPHKKRIRNALIFVVASECIGGLFSLVVSYLGGI